jgi:IMP dehydrogenase
MPRGNRVNVGHDGALEEVLLGPAHSADGRTNLMGALRHSMATCGYSDLKEFQRVDIVVTR